MRLSNRQIGDGLVAILVVGLFVVIDRLLPTLADLPRTVLFFPISLTNWIGSSGLFTDDHAVLFTILVGYPLQIGYWFLIIYELRQLARRVFGGAQQ